MKKKKCEPKCGNCRLFDETNRRCGVIILNAGEKINLPVDVEDDCFFEQQFIAIDKDGKEDEFRPAVQQVKLWTENPQTGEKTDGDGIVKIQYPETFFG